MEAFSSESWSKLHNKINKTFLKILVDKVSITSYKEMCEELNNEIILHKEQSERNKKQNDELRKQVAALKISHESKIRNLPTCSNICKRLKQCSADAEQRYRNREIKLKAIEREMKRDYDELVEESDAQWPECGQLKREMLELSKLELDLKMVCRDIEDEREKIRLKDCINKGLFNGAIIEFVVRVTDRKENIRIIAEIDRYTKRGNLLLREYEKAMLNADKRKRNEEFLQYNTMIKDTKKDDLPQMKPKGRPSPTPSTSSLLNSSFTKINYDNTASENYRQRERERKRRLQNLSKQNLLNSSFTRKQSYELKPNSPPRVPEVPAVKILHQVFMPGKHKAENNPQVEPKMPRLNSAGQFGGISSNSKFDLNVNFGKPKDKDVAFSKGNEILMQKANETVEDPVKQGQLTTFGQPKEVPKPNKNQPHATTPRRQASFEKDALTFVKQPEQKQPPAPSKPADDDVFKIPRPYDASFDFMNASYNPIPGNETQNSSFDASTLRCFSPPIGENQKEDKSGENANGSSFGTFLF